MRLRWRRSSSDDEDGAASPPRSPGELPQFQAQFVVAAAAPRAGLAVWHGDTAQPKETWRRVGTVARGHVVVGLEPPTADQWLRIQWLAAPDCQGWISLRADGSDELLATPLPAHAATRRGAAQLQAGTHSGGSRWRMPSLRGSPAKLSKTEEENVRMLVRKREAAAMQELIAEDLEHFKRAQQEQAAARAEAHFAFFDEAARRLRELGAFQTEGIFRVPGAADTVDALQRQVAAAATALPGDGGGGDLPVQERMRAVLQGCNDAHDMASLLSRWLRSQHPMVPPGYYAFCATAGLDAAMQPRPHQDAVEAIELCVDALPQPGQGLLRALVGLLQEIEAGPTRMTPENLGRVFAPTIMRRSDPAEMISHSNADTDFVTRLLRLLPDASYYDDDDDDGGNDCSGASGSDDSGGDRREAAAAMTTTSSENSESTRYSSADDFEEEDEEEEEDREMEVLSAADNGNGRSPTAAAAAAAGRTLPVPPAAAGPERDALPPQHSHLRALLTPPEPEPRTLLGQV